MILLFRYRAYWKRVLHLTVRLFVLVSVLNMRNNVWLYQETELKEKVIESTDTWRFQHIEDL